MRELKFRAWFNRFNKMVYEVDKDTFDLWKGYWNGKIHIVYPDDGDVVEQYTGLKDKNGKEIYEGDIVRFYGRYISVITWGTVTASFKWFAIEHIGDGYCRLSEFDKDFYEVIGNIHENPELLEDTNVPNKEEE